MASAFVTANLNLLQPIIFNSRSVIIELFYPLAGHISRFLRKQRGYFRIRIRMLSSCVYLHQSLEQSAQA